MQAPPLPPDEASRLAALRALHILDTPPEERFDAITRLVQRLFDMPIVLISLVDADRQWFKSRQGLDTSETPRDISFCGHAILGDGIFVVSDPEHDLRFCDNPLVVNEPNIRFYAGCPLTSLDGSRLGTLCMIDRKARELGEDDRQTFRDLAAWASDELNIRQLSEALSVRQAESSRLSAMLDNALDGIFSVDFKGVIESFNPAAERMFGYRAEEVIGTSAKRLLPEPIHSMSDAQFETYLSQKLFKMIGASHEGRGRRSDGDEFTISYTVSAAWLGQHRIYTAIVRDLSRHKQTGRRLSEITALRDAVLDSTTLAIFTADEEGSVQECNIAAQRLLGYDPRKLPGKLHLSDLYDTGDSGQTGFETLTELPRRGIADERECRLVCRDGTRISAVVTLTALRDERQTVIGYLMVGVDLTDRKRAEEALRASEERYDLAVSGSSDGIWDWDIAHNAIYYSPRFKQLLGYTPEEVEDDVALFSENVHPDDREAALAQIVDHLKYDTPYDDEFRLRTKGGDYRWYRARGRAMRNDSGWATRMAGSIQDVTPLKQAEDSLREITLLRQAILDSANFSIISTSTDGIIRTFNAGAQRLLGYSEDEVVGKVTPAIIHDLDEVVARAAALSDELGETVEPGFDAFVAKARRGEADENEWTYIRKDGSRFPVLLSVTAMRDDAGNLTGYLGIGSDISERKRIEEARERLAAIIEATTDFVGSTDMDGNSLFLNLAGRRMVGLDEHADISHLHIRDFHPPASVRKVLEEGIPEALARGFWLGQTTMLRRDGLEIPVSQLIIVHRDEHGRPVTLSAIARDITELKKIDQMKTEFVSTVSHELRTPLTSIRGALGLLSGGAVGELPEQARSLIDIAMNNSERLVRLINDILDIEKIESGKMTFDIEAQPLAPLIEQALAANQGFASEHGVRFEAIATLPDVQVAVDHDRIIQVITNLLSNAVKYSPKDKPVEIGMERLSNSVRVSVRDHGPGIPEAFRSRIFGKFAQADAADNRQKGGSGLGLSICKAIIDKHGGRIGFDTGIDGTVFHFDLPVLDASMPVNGRRSFGAVTRVLICEDDPDIAKLLALMLGQQHHESDIAYSAEQAKQLLAVNTYAAMTLDLMLPGQDGVSLLRELRSAPATRDLPIVVVSARADAARDEINGGAIGIIDWLDKPIDQSRLLQSIRHAMLHRRGDMPRVLHVEDDPDIVQVVKTILGSSAMLIPAQSLLEARARLLAEPVDLVILDISLPDGSGLDLLEDIKTRPNPPPVVVFSAQEIDQAVLQQVNSALVKSRTSNHDLIETIQSLIGAGPGRAGSGE